MAVTHSPSGFTSTVDEVAWAKLISSVTPRFRVASSSDWAVSVSGTTNLTVNVAAGSGTACGVQDTTTAGDTVTFAANSGGSNRYDALVARFVWGSDTVSFAVVQGTTSPPAVNTSTTVDNTKINRIPGTQYDALLAVVQIRPSVGLLASGDLFDMRPYGGLSGPVMLPNSTYLSLIDARAGAEVYAVDTTQRWLTLDGSTWTWPPEAQGEIARTDYSPSSSGVVLANSFTGLPAFNVTTSYIPANRRIRLTFRSTVSCDTAPTEYSFYLFKGTVPADASTALASAHSQMSIGSGIPVSPVGIVTTQTTTALTNQLWTVAGARLSGSGTVSIYAPCQFIIEDVGAV